MTWNRDGQKSRKTSPARLLSARSLRTVTTRCATGGGRGLAAHGPTSISRGWKRSKGGN